ncbi:MAG: hypothetical protein IJ240_06610 [Clostridia bacterium]|nr:hypothetical protein [Clostridia bacterium]
MFRLLLIAQNEATARMLETEIPWKEIGFELPHIATEVRDSDIADIARYAAVGLDDAAWQDPKLPALLSGPLKAVPTFTVGLNQQALITSLSDVRHLLNRLHLDYADEVYGPLEMMRIVQDELIHNLLNGSLRDVDILRRWFRMLRSDIPLDAGCRLYELMLPEGDLYLSDQWRHGQQRLENALRSNFFGRADNGAEYRVAFVDTKHVRMAAIPLGGNRADAPDFIRSTDEHVSDTIRDIREYLNLEIELTDARSVCTLEQCAR